MWVILLIFIYIYMYIYIHIKKNTFIIGIAITISRKLCPFYPEHVGFNGCIPSHGDPNGQTAQTADLTHGSSGNKNPDKRMYWLKMPTRFSAILNTNWRRSLALKNQRNRVTYWQYLGTWGGFQNVAKGGSIEPSKMWIDWSKNGALQNGSFEGNNYYCQLHMIAIVAG